MVGWQQKIKKKTLVQTPSKAVPHKTKFGPKCK